jgi:predicted nucleotidyltransferase component of viral defense system
MSRADSIKSRLKNIAMREQKPYDYLLMHYCIERLLYRLSKSAYCNTFILKGGMLLYTILDEKARATRDVDFLARGTANTLDSLAAIFKELCEMECDDAIEFNINELSSERIKEDAAYEGVRIKVPALLDRSRSMLQFDVGFGDMIVPDAVEMTYPSLLDMEEPVLKAYSIESVIAEKFEAMLYLAHANSRMKDFYDIFQLSRKFDFHGNTLFDAVEKSCRSSHTSG